MVTIGGSAVEGTTIGRTHISVVTVNSLSHALSGSGVTRLGIAQVVSRAVNGSEHTSSFSANSGT